MKRSRPPTNEQQSRHGKKMKWGAKRWKARRDSGSESGSEGEGFVKATPRTPGVIEKLGGTAHNRQTGLVSFHLANGKRRLATFYVDETVSNGYRLSALREYAANPSLSLPSLIVGATVGVFNPRRDTEADSRRRKGASHRVEVEVAASVPPEDEPKVNNLNGSTFEGTMTSLEVASFPSPSGEPLLALVTLVDLQIGEVTLSPRTYPHVIRPGMCVSLKITSSASTRIPGIPYAADAIARVPPSLPLIPEPSHPPSTYRGVILNLTDNLPSLFSCSLEDNKTFFVASEATTVNGQCTFASDLHFGVGTRVLVAVTFKHACNIAGGHLYEATVDLPLTPASVLTLMTVNGSSFPRILAASVDGEASRLVVARRDLRVNGGRPGSNFPRDFFKVDTTIEVSEFWKSSAFETRASLDISTRILLRGGAVASEGARRPPIDGVVTALRADARGMVLPSEADACVEGVVERVIIPATQVTVNARPGVYLPPSLVGIGDAVKLHNVRLAKETSAQMADVCYLFSKEELKKASEEHREDMSM